MTYELATKLKEAGFSQVMGNGEFLMGNLEEDETGLRTTNSVYVPNLSELIEACGEKVCLVEQNGKWNALKHNNIIQMVNAAALQMFITGYLGSGATPDEAAATLWLALQKNENNQRTTAKLG